MSDSVREVVDAEFADAIRTGLVLVDFWAPRCGPCRLQGPILEQVAAEVGARARIIKVDIDQNPAASNAFDFKSIPTLFLLKDGAVVLQFTGLQRKEALVSAINQARADVDGR
jgi:thioredoxin 1